MDCAFTRRTDQKPLPQEPHSRRNGRAADDFTAGKTAAQSRPFLKTPFSENEPRVSPDGRWLAYQSNESGRFEVYVRTFPDVGAPHQASTEGGISPAWSPDGNLFYRATNGMLMAVALTSTTPFTTGTPRALFDATRYESLYRVAPDGKRLLMMVLTDSEQTPTTISLVLNFIAELRQRVK